VAVDDVRRVGAAVSADLLARLDRATRERDEALAELARVVELVGDLLAALQTRDALRERSAVDVLRERS
jgi:hypothetical protein